jgi:putative Holliday junction resolvase
MKYLAVDYGVKRTGLAVCDPSQTICSPLAVLDSTKGLIDKLVEIIKTENIQGVVVGLPLNMDDTEGPQSKLVRQFAERLRKAVDVPIHFQDERLSSFGADEKLGMTNLSRTEKKQRRDALAAADILENFLRSQNE